MGGGATAMRALVTGGGGFLGGAIVRRLAARGDEVIALGRSRYPELDALGVATIQADIRDADAVRRACHGVDTVFHVAAIPGIWGSRSLFWGINVEGTRNVLAACRAVGVRRLVFTSSPSVVFGARPLCGVDESQPYPNRYLAHYPASKAAAERMVLAAHDDRLATMALRPHLIWGPGDPHLFPRIVARARAGRLAQVGDGRNLVDVTYIDNAALAHVLAADGLGAGRPCGGKAYFISQGEPVALWPWVNGILAQLGIGAVRRRVSYRAAYLVGAGLEAGYRLVGIRGEPPMTRFLASQLAHSHYFGIGRAAADLGYRAEVSTEEGVERMIPWLRSREGSGLR